MNFSRISWQPGSAFPGAMTGPCLRALMLAGLVLALLLLPLIGLMHGVLHGPAQGFETSSVSVQASHQASHTFDHENENENDHDHDHDHDHGNWVERLFAGHSQSADCLVFDQLCQGQALKALPLQVLPTLPPGAVLASLAGDFIARWAALFQARGPPPAR
jgi:hypothetical protein